MFFNSFALLALAASPTLANVFITNPTSSTTFHGGQQATLNWQDDSKAPSLQDMGNCTVAIYVGNALQQTSLQTIVESVDVSKTSAIQFTPKPEIGPNSAEYFIRIDSLTAKDSASPQYPAMSFSAKFKMDGMTGTFSSAIEAQIAGQSTAPLAGQTAPPAGATSPTGGASKTGGASSTSALQRTAASGSATPSNTASDNGAFSVKAGWAGILSSVFVYVAVL
ncbi:hypothetical protein AGABI2DRAFT_194933 [Agaricus bisporus var. bisporus H97]|uniref:hypothetical protein n=1 Tax=Agaricus bisporus var. bisporus (strain H97 / ATCC MYA-4626 / FGSC 10389) TaxID=936046 RepID=UPI00029F6B07|nr:hypothetical protein AGABI2DRAFT_194933 [Agaricus bisporus var. bisporus H97]EKV44050.1 hypothetical protein AGABI2DRAFT_194933 [Agaricus bisporus var. bisporus H97]